MFVNQKMLKIALSALPELLNKPEGWRAFKINRSHSSIQRLVHNFGKYSIYLDVRHRKVGEPPVFRCGPSQTIRVVNGKIEVCLMHYDRKIKKRSAIVADTIVAAGGTMSLTSHAAVIIIPRPIAHTVSFARKSKIIDKQLLGEEELPASEKIALLRIFREYFPGK